MLPVLFDLPSLFKENKEISNFISKQGNCSSYPVKKWEVFPAETSTKGVQGVLLYSNGASYALAIGQLKFAAAEHTS